MRPCTRRIASVPVEQAPWCRTTRAALPLHTKPMNVVFLFDVDNTLLDNDRVAADLRAHLDEEVGAEGGGLYWTFFEELRAELGYADYLGALQRYRAARPHEPRILTVSQFLITYPFANRLLPGSLDAVDHCATIGTTAILSDGDVVFQPRKIHRSGLYDAVGGRVLVYIHKEHELDDVEERLPADHYVLVDDKVRILAAVKAAWGSRVTTVWPRQGHYALDVVDVARYPAPDIAIERIGDLVEHHVERLVEAAGR
jgi:FMN phosphatase YigB (HAD superfamily)